MVAAPRRSGDLGGAICGLRDGPAYGDGRIECMELSRQYLQLTSLVGVA
jgi:hypothetical protein